MSSRGGRVITIPGQLASASCNSNGRGRGDNICSNMKVVEEECTIRPCATFYGRSLSLGDHALTATTLEVTTSP